MKRGTLLRLVIYFIVTFLATTSMVYSQEINLDKFEKFGDLLCYPSLKDPNVYYYLPDQPRLAMKDGRPQFSFLKYARTKETGEAGTGRAEGGGIVHFLVTYGADESRVKAAEKALQEKHEDARIAGPIIYRKGSFALVTSFKEGADTLTRTVAVGRAPLMEGQKAAVSMGLTREGAELLWESFKGETPDISLVFDMEFAGIREPYEATLEADWERISKHDRLQVGAQYKWFGVDVDMLFQELRQTGAIKITTKGEDATLDAILQSANSKLLSVMFDPAPDELTRMAAEKGSYDSLNQAVKLLKEGAALKEKKSELTPLPWPEHRVNPLSLALHQLILGPSTAQAAQKDPLKPAKDAFAKAEAFYQQENYTEALDWYKKALTLYDKADGKRRGALLFDIGQCLRMLGRCNEAVEYFRDAVNLMDKDEHQAKAFFCLGDCLEKMEKHTEALASFRSAASLYGEQSNYGKQSLERIAAISAKAYNEARRLDETARSGGYEPGPTQEALIAYQTYLTDAKPTGQRAGEVEGRIRFLKRKLEENQKKAGPPEVAEKETQPSPDVKPGEKEPGPSEKAPGEKDLEKQLEQALSDKSETSQPATEKETTTSTPAPSTGTTTQDKDKKEEAAKAKPKSVKASPAAKSRKSGTPGFSLVASYRMKRIKRSGKMVYQMNHYRTEMQAFAMTENIGDLYRRYGNDSRVFRAVNIDDPVFKQREILVTLDGQDSETFSKHLNFVTVQMKKRHQSGELTTDEVVITPEKFNESGNAFILSYGWKGDDDRTAWLDYHVETLWSFHGGMEIRIPWAVYDRAMLALQPPHRYRAVTVEGEGDVLTHAQVRHAVVTFTSSVGGKPVSTEATIRNRGPAPSLILDIPEDRDGLPTQVSITWYLRGGKTVTAPPRLLEGDIIYWDELPEKGV
jgi:tetratricopeptide (TPR) repeat protein